MSKPLNSLLPNSLLIPSLFPGILPHFPPQPLYKYTLGFIFMEIQPFLSTLCSPMPLCFAHTVPVIWKSPFPSSIFYVKVLLPFKALPKLPYTMLLIPCDGSCIHSITVLITGMLIVYVHVCIRQRTSCSSRTKSVSY